MRRSKTAYEGYAVIVLKIVNAAVNISSNLIGCFEVVPLAPAPTII